jgi:hypothetical protein
VLSLRDALPDISQQNLPGWGQDSSSWGFENDNENENDGPDPITPRFCRSSSSVIDLQRKVSEKWSTFIGTTFG